MKAIGHEIKKQPGGTHIVLHRTDQCPWPDVHVSRANIPLATGHQGHESRVCIGKTRDWGRRLEARGVNFDLILRYFQLRE